ncbi:MAG: cytochrome P450 [Acidimicrobiales bacterium]
MPPVRQSEHRPDGPVRRPPVQAAKPTALKLANNPRLLLRLARPVRRFLPILVVGRRVIVTRHADVCEILERDDVFTVADANGPTMDRVNGPFILGMDRSEQYLRERAILQRCVHPDDPARIRAFVRAAATDAVAAMGPSGRLDVVADLARVVAVRLVAHYFGVSGPDEDTMKRWMRTIFHETFLNVGADPAVRRRGEASAAELHVFVDDLVAARRGEVSRGAAVPDDFVTRLVKLQAEPGTQLSDEGIRRNLGGVIVGAVDTTSKAVTHAVDELLRRPEALAGAAAAAQAGDIDAVGRHAFEALRFNPLNPVLARDVARTALVAAGTKRQRCLPAGRHVYAAVLPAMFDPAVFDQPNRFRTDRPPGAYLHFGGGLHDCFGRQVNLIQIPEVVAALVALPGLRRHPGAEGAMVYDGPFPDHLVVEFGPPAGASS